MNKDKVYLKGYVVGHTADTLDYRGLQIQLENLDIVEIDKNLVHKDINKPQLLKLKDVIARIKGFDLGTQKVWVNEILNELGSNYGTLKYKAGHEQGKAEGEWVGQQLKDADKIRQELNKPVVPQFVADWIEYFKNCKGTLYGSTNPFSYYGRAILEDFEGDYDEVLRWIRDNSDTYARAWLDGYEVEKEKRYLVKLKCIHSESEYLYYGMGSCKWRFRGKNESGYFRKNHTRKELEQAGFGWVFDCEGIEIEEVDG